MVSPVGILSIEFIATNAKYDGIITNGIVTKRVNNLTYAKHNERMLRKANQNKDIENPFLAFNVAENASLKTVSCLV